MEKPVMRIPNVVPSQMRSARSPLLRMCSVLLLATLAHGQTPTSQLISPNAVAVDVTLHRAFAVDPDHDRVLVYDEATRQQTSVAAGRSPIALALDQQAHRVYVVNAAGGNVTVLDARTSAVLATLPTDSHPYAVAVDSQTQGVLVSNTFSNKLTVIDGASLQSVQKPLGSKDAIAVDAEHGEAFLLSYEDTAVTVITTAGAAPRTLPARIHLWSMAVDAPHRMLYATAIGDHALEVLSTVTGERHEIRVGNFSCAVVLNADGSRAYVANREDNTVTVVNTATRSAIATIATGKAPQALAIDNLHHRIFVANTASGTITVIDSSTNRVIGALPAGSAPYALAADQTTGELFAATLSANPFLHFSMK